MALQQKVGTNRSSTNSRSDDDDTNGRHQPQRNHKMTVKVTMTLIHSSWKEKNKSVPH